MSNGTESKELKQDSPEYEFKYFGPLKRLVLIFFLAFMLFLFFATLILILLTKSTKELKVPDLLGRRFVEVSNSLTNRGFRTNLKFADVYDLEDGIILNQSPESGRIVEENSKITLTISRSKFFVNVPNLTGSMLPMAINKLKNDFDIVVLGHLHIPISENTPDGLYLNTGDFIRHFSYVKITESEQSLSFLDKPA